MNDVGGSDSGTGLRAGKSSRTSDANFEYDDSEWDVGIGNLIIDLDADIEKNNEANKTSTNSTSTGSNSLNHNTSNNSSTNNSPLTSGSTASSSQMHIPHVSTASTGSSNNPSSSSVNSAGKGKSSTPNLPSESKSAPTVTSDSKDLPSSMESAIVDKGLKMKIKRTKTGTKSGADAKHEIVKSDLALATASPTSSTPLSTGPNSNSNSNSSSGSNKSGGSGSTDSMSSKSAHPSSSHKDKVKDNNMSVLDGERDKPSANSIHSGPASNANNGVCENSPSNDQGGKAKTPRKCSTHKKVKSGNNGNGSSKKDDRNSNIFIPKGATKSLSSGSHAKDGKDFFSTTVSLNVPNIVPSSNSLAKTTLKVPIANNSSNSLNSQHSVPLLSSIDSSSSSTARLSSSNSLWPSSSPSKPGDKGVPATPNSAVDKGQGSPSYGKKPRSYPAAVDKVEENAISHGTSTNSNSSYRNVPSSSDISSPSSFASINNNQAGSAPLSLFTHTSPKGRISQGISSTQDVCIGTSVGTVTEPDCLGPCEPGTSVTLEGIVWHETESGVLVVNVTWRGKTYVGTLLDCTKNDWAPPRFCDSPTSDLEMRTPKNRGKRGRGQVATPVNEVQSDAPRGPNPKLRNGAKGRRGSASTTAFVAPASPIKSEQWPKRKTRGSENESQDEPIPKNAKRPKVAKDGDRKERQSSSPAPEEKTGGPSSPVLIECPEPNCSKKYKHINGLRYHQSHAHCNNFTAEDSDSNASTTSTQLTTPLESGVSERPISEAMEVDGLCDLDGSDTISIAPEELGISEKRNPPFVENISGTQKVEENSFLIITDNEVGDKEKPDEAESLLVINKNYMKSSRSQKEISSTDNKEGEIKSLVEAPNKELSPSSITSRAPILTVPVPYISLQNRPLVHGNTVNAPRGEPVLGSRDHDSIVMKPLLMNTASTGNPSSLPSKGVPWQPHAHSNPIPTMSVHSQPNMSVPLNIPLSGNNDKISVKDRDKDRSFSDSHSKKSKHKKKSRDKEKDGKSRSLETRNDGKIHGEAVRIGSMFASSIPPTNPIESRGESADDLRMSKRDDSIGPKNDASRHSGDNRDDPQSPAYSDISDANDSGDADISVSVSKETCKNLVQPDLKKDSPVVGGGLTMPSYYPSFYSPYLDSNHSSKLGDKSNSCDESEKGKPVKPIPQSHSQVPPTGSIPPPSVPGNPEDNGRSAKLDFHHPKYLPHQQHFFHYPFSNYHFDQGQYNNVNPENPFAPGRSFPVEEREKERELMSDHSKAKLGDKDGGMLNIPIKKEPSDRFKDSRQSNMGKSNPEEKQIQIKSEFGPEYGDPKPIPHFMGATCSKHSKDPKRDDPSKSDTIRSGPINEKSSTKDSMESEKDMREREREREKTEGSKPTMETQGPPPPPTAGSYAYIPQPYLQGNPFGLHFDPGHPLYRQVLVPGPYGGPPYMHPGSIPRFQPPPGSTPLPEDLSRPSAQPTGPSSKALDLLQHHAAQYYSVHKIHELSERALKSPSPQVSQKEREHPSGSSVANAPASPVGLSPSNVGPNPRSTVNNSGVPSASSIPKPADLSKDSKMGPGGPINESSRSPPTQHHVHSHTHHHTHVGIGYPALIPAFPAPHSPHYGVIPTTPAAATVIPPFPSQKPN